MTDLDRRLDVLEAELAAARRQLADTRQARTSRRTAIGAGILGALGLGAVRAGTASAADGSSLQLGAAADANNTATTPTTLTYSGPALAARSALTVGAAPASGDHDDVHPAAVGGYAKGALVNGVHGSSTRVDGYGVVAQNTSTFDLDKRGGVALLVESTGGHVQFVGGTGDFSQPGVYPPGTLVYSDEIGLRLWVPGGEIGSHPVLLADESSAGALHLLASPVRVYDSRTGTGTAATGDGPITSGSERTIDLGATGVFLEGTHGVMLNLTITDTRAAGFVALYSAAVSYPGTSNINWSSNGQTLANLVVTRAEQGRVTVHAGGGGSTEVVIDLVGVYNGPG